jgi:hypothetical protein
VASHDRRTRAQAAVTLILAMSKPEGIYMSVDFRVSDSKTRECLDDASVKFLTVQYPPDVGGPTAVFAYTGLAMLPDGTHVGDWLRETLRGETQLFDASMQHLLERLNRDLARYRAPLIVNILVLAGERRYSGGFSNVNADFSIRPSFGYQLQDVTGQPGVFFNGSGARRVIDDGHGERLRQQLTVRPRHPHNHMKLLASVNRRVAKVESSVSPHCQVIFISADDRSSGGSMAFLEHGESVPFRYPSILMGIDLSYVAENFHQSVLDTRAGASDDFALDPDEVNKNLKRRD